MKQTDRFDTNALREIAPRIGQFIRDDWGDGVAKAADHIDAQAAEIERLREALRWSAGALQAACQSSYCSDEGDQVAIGTEFKTVSQILDSADSALSGEPT